MGLVSNSVLPYLSIACPSEQTLRIEKIKGLTQASVLNFLLSLIQSMSFELGDFHGQWKMLLRGRQPLQHEVGVAVTEIAACRCFDHLHSRLGLSQSDSGLFLRLCESDLILPQLLLQGRSIRTLDKCQFIETAFNQ